MDERDDDDAEESWTEGEPYGSLATNPSLSIMDITVVRCPTTWVRPAQTARSERTPRPCGGGAGPVYRAGGRRERRRRISADAGVSLRTSIATSPPSTTCCFGDYDAGLHWFRSAWRRGRPTSRSSSPGRRRSWRRPTKNWASPRSRRCAHQETRPEPAIVPHIRRVEARLRPRRSRTVSPGDNPPAGGHRRADAHQVTGTIIAARCRRDGGLVLGDDRSLPEMDRLCREALNRCDGHRQPGLTEVFVIIDKMLSACQSQPMTDYDGLSSARANTDSRGHPSTSRRIAHTVSRLEAVRRRDWHRPWSCSTATKFEIAGSVQIRRSATVSKEIGLDELPTSTST